MIGLLLVIVALGLMISVVSLIRQVHAQAENRKAAQAKNLEATMAWARS